MTSMPACVHAKVVITSSIKMYAGDGYRFFLLAILLWSVDIIDIQLCESVMIIHNETKVITTRYVDDVLSISLIKFLK